LKTTNQHNNQKVCVYVQPMCDFYSVNILNSHHSFFEKGTKTECYYFYG